jgi:hypothetical protein
MDNLKIYPLQMGNVDWKIYIEVCKEFLGESPTRGIDSAGIKTDNPVALLKTLDFNNNPLNAMNQEHLYKHIFFSFILITDLPTIAQISERSCLSVAFVEKRNKALAIFSGTLDEWKYGIVYCSNKTAETQVREVANGIFHRFEIAGFKEIWDEYRITPDRDGTFIMERKH